MSSVINQDDIVYQIERILELKDIEPDQRGPMIDAIIAEISGLCKLGVFSLEVSGSLNMIMSWDP